MQAAGAAGAAGPSARGRRHERLPGRVPGHPAFGRGGHAGGAGARRLVVQELGGRVLVQVRQHRRHRAGRGVQLEAGHPQAALQRALPQGQGLRLLVGDHHQRPDDPPGPQEDRAVRPGDAVAAPRDRVEEPGPGRVHEEAGGVPAAREPGVEQRPRVGQAEVGEDEPESEQGLVTVADRQEHGLGLLAAVLAVPDPVSRDVHLDPPPVLAPPERALGEPHGLHPTGRDGLCPRLEQAVPQADPVR